MARVEAARVKVRGVERCVLAVELLGHDHIVASKDRHVAQNVIAVGPDGVGPRQVVSARVFVASLGRAHTAK